MVILLDSLAHNGRIIAFILIIFSTRIADMSHIIWNIFIEDIGTSVPYILAFSVHYTYKL